MESNAPSIRKGLRVGWHLLLIMMVVIHAKRAASAWLRLEAPSCRHRSSKTASSTTLTSSKRLWKTTSTAATKNSNLSVRPRMRPTVRAMLLTRPLKRFRASVRVSLRPVATAWLPLRLRVPSRAPMSSTLRLTRQSGLAIAVLFLPRCWRPMGRRRKTTCFRDFSRH